MYLDRKGPTNNLFTCNYVDGLALPIPCNKF